MRSVVVSVERLDKFPGLTSFIADSPITVTLF